jgi:serine protease AprX
MFLRSVTRGIRRKAVWGPKRRATALFLVLALGATPAAFADHGQSGKHTRPGQVGASAPDYRLDSELTNRAAKRNPNETTRVIVELKPGVQQLPSQFRKFAKGNRLDILNGVVAEVPNGLLKQIAAHSDIFRVHYDRPLSTLNYRTSVTVGATALRQTPGFTGVTGSGVGVAVIDSGVASWHDDLVAGGGLLQSLFPYGNQRVTKFVDFVNGRTQPYDDHGHGTHVAGTILGNGYDSLGQKAGIAPGASLIALKALDANGQGTISGIITALNWVAANYKTYNIKVVNLSVGAPIHESFWTDPLTLACKALADRGIVVVAAAGNLGKNAAGQAQWGGITAPGNAPWVLTVGASSTMGTLTRADDTMADFSSRGPSYIDYSAKPDLVAPGVGTVSLAAPGSTFYTTKAQFLLAGLLQTATKPYIALSGTSMSAPVVSGTVALMLQVNPNLTPNLVKAILQYTAQVYPGYSPLQEGAGFLNTLGAVKLAKFYATAKSGDRMPYQTVWSRHIVWGNHMIAGGYIDPRGTAWASNIVWGAAVNAAGAKVTWGSMCGGCDNIVWGAGYFDNIVWGNSYGDNIVWGAGYDGDNIVWGSGSDDNIVWGSSCGGGDCDNIVWGASNSDNIVWGNCSAGDNVLWGSSYGDNIVWGSSADSDASWGSSDDSDTAPVVFDDSAIGPLPSVELEFGDVTTPDTTTTTLPGGGL